MKREVEFWMGGNKSIYHFVDQRDIDACYNLPKDSDRWAYWRKVTGDPLIKGHVLVWFPMKWRSNK